MLFSLTLLFSGLVAAAPYYTPIASPSIEVASEVSVKRSDDSILNRMSDSEVLSICKTCWGGALEWPLPNTPAPVVDVVSPQLSIFERPASSPNTLTIHNYCSYDIHYTHFSGSNQIDGGSLTAGQTITGPLAGTVFKASKTADGSKDLLIEYNIGADGQLWFDLSLITCAVDGDVSACPGHEAGLQLGNAGSKSFQCAAGAWCDDQAYLYQVS